MDDEQLQTVITMLMGALDTALSRIANLEARIAALESPDLADDVRADVYRYRDSEYLRMLDAMTLDAMTGAPLQKLDNSPLAGLPTRPGEIANT